MSTASTTVNYVNVLQKYSWDCGLACVQTLLRACGAPGYESLYSMVTPGNLWTIDLAFLLWKFGVDFSYCTTCIGVNIDHSNLDFYAATLAEDAPRVNKLFSDAQDIGMKVENRSLDVTTVRSHIKQGLPVIVLIDASVLRWDYPLQEVDFPDAAGLSSSSSDLNFDSNLAVEPPLPEYVGHYILVVDYHDETDEFAYFDPNFLSEKRIKSDVLDKARKSSGTDEDILFIHSPAK